jgi:glucuronokinase
MSTGRQIVTTCPARAALAGNPSDGYGGAVVAVPVPDLTAIATFDPSPSGRPVARTSDAELRRLLDATVDAYAEHAGVAPAVSFAASTSIPRSVGLAGSSALVIAVLRGLGEWEGRAWDPIELATLALSVERDRLGIEAGLQDRLVQAVGRPVAMTFAPIGYDVLELPTSFQLFVAWDPAGAEPSGTVHRSLRRRFDAGDTSVTGAMSELAVQAGRARRAIIDADARLLADAMHRTLGIRLRIVELGERQRRLVEIGRGAGAAINSAGSGGSVVGLARTADHLDELERAYESVGLGFLSLV